jgi:hypothetical protein
MIEEAYARMNMGSDHRRLAIDNRATVQVQENRDLSLVCCTMDNRLTSH